MIESNIGDILGRLKKSTHPVNLALLEEVGSISWNEESYQHIDILSEILLMVSAQVIMRAYDKNNEEREVFEKTFHNISNDIHQSGVTIRYPEFGSYYEKYLFYLTDFKKESG